MTEHKKKERFYNGECRRHFLPENAAMPFKYAETKVYLHRNSAVERKFMLELYDTFLKKLGGMTKGLMVDEKGLYITDPQYMPLAHFILGFSKQRLTKTSPAEWTIDEFVKYTRQSHSGGKGAGVYDSAAFAKLLAIISGTAKWNGKQDYHAASSDINPVDKTVRTILPVELSDKLNSTDLHFIESQGINLMRKRKAIFV
jgi:hypothetical protein